MEKMKNKARRICGLIGGICLLFFATKVYAVDCMIEVQLEDLKVPWSDWENVTMTLYDVGDVSTYGGPQLDSSFGIPKYPTTAEESREAVDLIEKKLIGAPVMRLQTDKKGRVNFSGLPDGVYLIKAEQTEKYGVITSALVHLPYYEIVNDQKLGPLYTVKVNPKASKPEKPQEPGTPTNTPKPSEKPKKEPTPTITVRPGGNDSGGNGGGSGGGNNGSGKSQNAKTGDESQTTDFWILLGTAAVLAGWLIHKRRKVSE